MSRTEWTEILVPGYTSDEIQVSLGAGGSLQEAEEFAERGLNACCPKGFDTPLHHFLTLVEIATDSPVGTLWFFVPLEGPNPSAFVYDLRILESHRGKGFGKELMALLEDEVRRAGARSIGMNVRGNNRVARALYDRAGYEPENIFLVKKV